QSILGALALGDVVIGLENGDRPGPIPLDGPADRDNHFGTVTLGMRKLAFPAIMAKQLRPYLRERPRKDGMEQLVGDPAQGVFAPPAVQLLGATVPEGDDVVHVTGEDGVVSDVEQACLLAQNRACRLNAQSKEGGN